MQRYASVCLKKEDRSQSTPLHASLFLTTWRHSTLLYFISQSWHLFLSCAQLLHENQKIIRGFIDSADKGLSPIGFASADFFLFSSVAAFIYPPFVSYFFCSMQIFFALCLTVNFDDTATFDLSRNLRGSVLHGSVCVCVCVYAVGGKHVYGFRHVFLFVCDTQRVCFLPHQTLCCCVS